MLTFQRPKSGASSEPPVAEVVHTDKTSGKKRRKRMWVSYDKPTDGMTEYRCKTDEHVQMLAHILSNQRFSAYVSGASGSGKSVAIADMLRMLKKDPKTRHKPIYLFSAVTEFSDPAYAGLDIKHVGYEKKELLLQLTVDHLKESITLWDDYNQSQDEEVNKYMLRLLTNVLELGRKMEIDAIVVNHNTRDFGKTRAVIFECDTYVLFPATNRNASLKFLREYGDMSKLELEWVRTLDEGRFTRLVIRKAIPRLAMSRQRIIILS